ncbi:MAG: Tol-Pal system protein TolB [Alphaproteobacteria bacterium]|nr:MAG: Tol-Pal system protein TolB [Alphaproteobacteria bacterium]
MRNLSRILTAALFILPFAAAFVPGQAHAKVTIDLSAPNAAPLPIAIPNFSGDTPDAQRYAADIAGVIRSDIGSSTPFRLLKPESYLQTPEQITASGPVFADWRAINADAMVTAVVKMQEGGKLRVEVRLFDAQTEQQLYGTALTDSTANWRYIAHRISDDIYKTLTGEPGYFFTRIVHIGETKAVDGKGGTLTKLCIMDSDGANYQCLTDGTSLVLSPRFNPNLQKVVYMSYASGVPRLYLWDINSGQQTIIGDFEGLNSTPRFNNKGTKLAMTLTAGHEGNAEIYEMDMSSRTLKRLTYQRTTDTSPSYSPDDKQIVFSSDRAGQSALYIMDADGSNVRRLTYGQGRYYSPAWSPRGDLIAFIKQAGGKFNVGVIDPQGGEERILTDSFMDDNPTWAPNGRVLVFSRQQNRSDRFRIFTIDLTGYNLRELPTPTNASDPAWSPLMR